MRESVSTGLHQPIGVQERLQTTETVSYDKIQSSGYSAKSIRLALYRSL